MQIYPVNHGEAKRDRNRFCGPSAISAVTRMTTGEAARLLRTVSRSERIMGVAEYHMFRALALCGITARRVTVKPISPPILIKGKTCIQPTLAQWLKDSVAIRTAGRVFLVIAGNHYQLISGRRFVCGRVGEIISITDKRCKRRSRVESVYELVASKIVIPAAAKQPARRKKVEPEYTRFRKLAKERGWTYHVYDECGLKYLMIKPCPDWPEGLDTMHYDWDSTMGRIEHCLEYPEDVIDGCYSE